MEVKQKMRLVFDVEFSFDIDEMSAQQAKKDIIDAINWSHERLIEDGICDTDAAIESITKVEETEILSEARKRFSLATMEEKLIEVIEENGEDGELDLTEDGLCWTFYDDDGDGYAEDVDCIRIEHDCNGAPFINVGLENGDQPLSALDYEDEHGDNFAEWLYEEVCDIYE